MKLDALLKFSKVLPLFGLLIVYGCGGGSGTTASVPSTMQPDTGTGMQPDTGTGMQPDTGTGMQPDTGTGMQPGTGTGMQPAPMEPARTAPGLGELFSSEPGRAYSTTISATVLEDYASDTAELLTDLFVKSITRNASGGYDIVYRDGSNDMTVSILPEHCGVNAGCQIPADANGRTYWFWSNTNYSNSNSLAGPGGFKFMEASGFAIYDGSTTQRRSYFLFGVETPASAVPATGEAIYAGFSYAEGDRTGEPVGRVRQRYYGRMRLVANFDMSRLTGQIFSIQGRAGSSRTRDSWPTSSFTITNGQISNGQFTADLTGKDRDSSVPDAESVRGFLGSIVAKFYGPNADEVGGAITATRDLQGTDNDRQLYGYIVGSKLSPRMLGSAAFATRVSRRFGDQQTMLLTDDGMASVVRTENGWNVTVGGRTFALSDTAFESNPIFQNAYFSDDGSRVLYLTSVTGGFHHNSRFDHLDVKIWGLTEPHFTDPDNVSSFVYLVHGNRTPSGSLPANGTATYTGEMWAREWPSDQAVLTNDAASVVFRGDASMTANFGTASITGTFSNLANRPGI